MRIILHFPGKESLAKVLEVVMSVMLEGPEELSMVNSLMDEIILLGFCEVVAVAVPTLMQSIFGVCQKVDMVLSVSLEPVHLMAEDDVLHQLRGVGEHGAGAHHTLKGNLLGRCWTGIDFEWRTEVSKESTIVIFILDLLH